MKSESYDEFVEKFKPKLTTDDCITPPLVYEAIKDWVCKEYNIDPESIVRPFWPGGDYEHFDYPEGCTVLDNPPFSILSKICEWYLERGIKFFLFAPSLTCLSGKNTWDKMNHVIANADITYENGAIVRTAFVTNLGDGETVIQTAPDLGKAISIACEEISKDKKRQLPKYEYPDHVLTAALMQKYCGYGIEFSVKKKDCTWVSRLDAQRPHKKTIFGSGLLLSERAAAERAAAERAAAERANVQVWKLSEREMEVVKQLGGE